MIVSGLLEFFLGNTFQFILFCGYGTAFATQIRIRNQTLLTVFSGSFWLSLGATLTPYFGAYEHYSADATNAAAGLSSVGFNASFGRATKSLKRNLLTKESRLLLGLHGRILLPGLYLCASNKPLLHPPRILCLPLLRPARLCLLPDCR